MDEDKSWSGTSSTRDGFAYRSGIAFESALAVRFKAAARGGADATALRRQFAYDRLLNRVFTTGPGAWVLKGGTALLSRVRTARHTLDIDLLHDTATDLENAAADLRIASATDMGDFFRFEIGPTSMIAAGGDTPVDGLRVAVIAFCGRAAPFAQFHIDLVITDHMTASPEMLLPTPVVDIVGLPQSVYRVYPVVDHVADKVTATRQRYGGKPSSRVRDLVDIVIIARSQRLDARRLAVALDAKRRLHKLSAITSFSTPSGWVARYSKAAAHIDIGSYNTYPQALSLAKQLLDPVLDGTRTRGTWDPDVLSWTDHQR